MEELEKIKLAELSDKYIFITHKEFDKIQELVKQLQQELDKYKAKEKELREYIKIFIPYCYDKYNNEYIEDTQSILDILDKK
jgi:HPt (histidine-containing phosphotransfer) domain-containing protein